MATEIVMPQMGESVAEGTIVRWLKKVGDTVERDEPLFEISTDKVDAEIPSPSRGVLTEIRHPAGATVEINTVVAVISAEGEQPPVSAPPPPTVAHPPAAVPVPLSTQPSMVGTGRRVTAVARRAAAVHHVDLARVAGSGDRGRVMKADVLALVAGATSAVSAAPSVAPASAMAAPKGSGVSAGAGLAGQTVPMTVMRKKIAAHMLESKRTSAHVYTVIEVNFSPIEKVRHAIKVDQGRPTYLSFILKAVAGALKAVPVVNASVEQDTVVYHPQVNVGVAVALDWGLIVPVIHDVDRKSLFEISATVADLAGRARQKKLKPEEVAGGTFTVTNHGVSGSLIGLPIINQPQVAILAVGMVEKRVVAVNDALAIRRSAYLTLGYDHRVIDGAVADQFLAHIKHALEDAEMVYGT